MNSKAGYEISTTAIFTGLHFLVDFCCAFCCFRLITGTAYAMEFFLLYNFFAFAMQMPVGLLADRWKKSILLSCIGCILIGLMTLYPLFAERLIPMQEYCPIVMVIWIGLGNCFFHVGGGIAVMQLEEEKLSLLGTFVSSGAIGVFLGSLWGKQTILPTFLPFFVLLTAGVILYLSRHYFQTNIQTTNTAVNMKKTAVIALICYALVVVNRSYLGTIFNFPWKATLYGGICALAAIVLGKMFGGFLADRIGVMKTAMSSMIIAGVAFAFSDWMPCGIIGLFFFNMSMPLTLFAATKILKCNKGFAFGILTFAIYLGFLPPFFGWGNCTNQVLVILSALSAVLFMIGEILRKKGE